MANWSIGFGSAGFCFEMSFPSLWREWIKDCLYGVSREVLLKKGHCFVHGSILMLVVKDRLSIC